MYTPLKDSDRMTDCFMVSEASHYTKCWDSQPEPIKDAMKKDHSLQGLLFSLGNTAQKPQKVENHPTSNQRAKKPMQAPVNPSEAPKPYVPRHHTYAEHLKWFNGDTSLAMYWFNRQNIKD